MIADKSKYLKRVLIRLVFFVFIIMLIYLEYVIQCGSRFNRFEESLQCITHTIIATINNHHISILAIAVAFIALLHTIHSVIKSLKPKYRGIDCIILSPPSTGIQNSALLILSWILLAICVAAIVINFYVIFVGIIIAIYVLSAWLCYRYITLVKKSALKCKLVKFEEAMHIKNNKNMRKILKKHMSTYIDLYEYILGNDQENKDDRNYTFTMALFNNHHYITPAALTHYMCIGMLYYNFAIEANEANEKTINDFANVCATIFKENSRRALIGDDWITGIKDQITNDITLQSDKLRENNEHYKLIREKLSATMNTEQLSNQLRVIDASYVSIIEDLITNIEHTLSINLTDANIEVFKDNLRETYSNRALTRTDLNTTINNALPIIQNNIDKANINIGLLRDKLRETLDLTWWIFELGDKFNLSLHTISTCLDHVIIDVSNMLTLDDYLLQTPSGKLMALIHSYI